MLNRDYANYSGQPTLSAQFINCNPDDWEGQIFAVTDDSDKFFIECENVVQARRPMPYFADYKLQ